LLAQSATLPPRRALFPYTTLFRSLGNLLGECCGGADAHNACYLGPVHNGVRLSTDPKKPLRYASPGPGTFQEEQRGEFGLLGRLNRLTEVEYPDDPALRARIKSYELAFRMQTAVPEVFRLDRETEAT